MSNYLTHVPIKAGADFSHVFDLTNHDGSPTNLTSFVFTGYLAKHATSVLADVSTSTEPVWDYLPLTCAVVDGLGGIFSISLTKQQTAKLEEGKYVYAVTMVDGNGNTYGKGVSGIAFVECAMNPQIGTIAN